MKQIFHYLGEHMKDPQDYIRWNFNFKFYQKLAMESKTKYFNLTNT